MTDQYADAELRRQAELRVGVRTSFYIHATVYAIVNAGLATINLLTTPQTLWFLWPLAGWGIGLVLHGFGAFFELSGGRTNAVEAEIARMRNKVDRPR